MVIKKELKLEHLSKTYYHFSSSSEILINVGTTIRSSEVNFLCGLNGSGKTTLFKILAGIIEPNKSGLILLDGVLLKQSELKKEVVFIPQNIDDAFVNNLFVYEYVSLFNEELIKDLILKIGAEWLLKVIEIKSNILLKELSQGQRQLLLILAMLSLNQRIILFDEIFSSLDEKYQEKLWQIIIDIIKEKDLIALFITHDYDFAFNNADRILVLNKGNLVLDNYKLNITKQIFINKIYGNNYNQR